MYNFWSGRLEMANRKDEFVQGKFQDAINPKDSYVIEDCIDERHYQLLQFLVPILHSEKPTRVTISLANTIFSAMKGDRRVDYT